MHKPRIAGVIVIVLAGTAAGQSVVPPKSPTGVNVIRDVEYARVGDKSLKMDLYLPEEAKSPLPGVVYIHGGGWRRGDKKQQTGVPLVAHGYVVASINHRFSQEAIFPAQIEDCKAAVRFLRANAKKYSIDPDHLGVWGDSSGGHLSALTGTSGDVKELEGKVGDHLDQSSRVQAACVYYAPIDFISIMSQKSDIKRGSPEAPESQLLGGPTLEHRELAIQACPLTYVSKDDPPFLIVHGEKDVRVPLEQAEALRAALQAVGVEATIHIVEGAGHGFNAAQSATAMPVVAAFFDRHLKGK
jgi:acetyl esterase/lipase